MNYVHRIKINLVSEHCLLKEIVHKKVHIKILRAYFYKSTWLKIKQETFLCVRKESNSFPSMEFNLEDLSKS